VLPSTPRSSARAAVSSWLSYLPQSQLASHWDQWWHLTSRTWWALWMSRFLLWRSLQLFWATRYCSYFYGRTTCSIAIFVMVRHHASWTSWHRKSEGLTYTNTYSVALVILLCSSSWYFCVATYSEPTTLPWLFRDGMYSCCHLFSCSFECFFAGCRTCVFLFHGRFCVFARSCKFCS